MTRPSFRELLEARWAEGKFVCVGLDSALERVPVCITGSTYERVFAFNQAIAEATHDLVASYKPNLAFYLAQGAEGIRALVATCALIRELAPGVVIILDGKFGDIGNTNDGYADFAFKQCGADAVTVHPYLGQEALAPFLQYPGKGVIVLCRTSNPGAREFQDLFTLTRDPRQKPEGMSAEEWLGQLSASVKPLYLRVAERVATQWNNRGNCLVVVGATYPAEAGKIREQHPDLPFLVPGVGKQGGDVEKIVLATRDRANVGFIINSSREIIFASDGVGFAEAARVRTFDLDQKVRSVPPPVGG